MADSCAGSVPWTVDSVQLAEGAHTYRALAWGTESGESASEPWTVTIDRTAPNAPHDRLADFDEESGEGDIDDCQLDPASYRCAYPDGDLDDDVHHAYDLTVGFTRRTDGGTNLTTPDQALFER